MKKILVALSLVLTLTVFTEPAFAQQSGVPAQCSTVNSSNFPTCCPSNLPNIAQQCARYIAGVCASNPQDPVCIGYQTPPPITGPRGGSPISTTPQNTAGSGNGVGSGFTDDTAKLSACQAIKFKNIINILVWLKCIIIVGLIPLIFALAFLFFLWGVLRFMMASDVKSKKEAQQIIWWGLIGLFVMVSIWGIIKILGTTLGIESTVPTLQTTYLKATP